MKIYHGEPGAPDLQRCRESAPSFDHGMMMASSLTNKDEPWALDNGAFVCWNRGEHWLTSGRAEAFVRQVKRIHEKPRQPDFVVLPDVVADAEQTVRRSEQWATIIREEFGLTNLPLYVACQNGMGLAWVIALAGRVNADGIFVGGDMDYKQSMVPKLVETDYTVHIGRPGSLVWANHVGADSVDSTSIVRNNAWHRLENLEEQTELTEA